MGKIKPGQNLPSLSGTSFNNGEINLSQFKGSPLILSFYRYAACPFCNLRMHHFINKYKEELEALGIKAVAVFQSPTKSISKYLSKHDTPFDIIADPKQLWYKKMGLKTSWLGAMAAMTNVSQALEATQKGMMNIDPEGPINRLPADFLISADQKVQVVYYGKNISDHIPFEAIDKWSLKIKGSDVS